MRRQVEGFQWGSSPFSPFFPGKQMGDPEAYNCHQWQQEELVSENQRHQVFREMVEDDKKRRLGDAAQGPQISEHDRILRDKERMSAFLGAIILLTLAIMLIAAGRVW